MRRPTVAVGSVTPEGLAAAVVIRLLSVVRAPWPCALVPAVTAALVLNVMVGVVMLGEELKTKEPDPVSLVPSGGADGTANEIEADRQRN